MLYAQSFLPRGESQTDVYGADAVIMLDQPNAQAAHNGAGPPFGGPVFVARFAMSDGAPALDSSIRQEDRGADIN
jgi:hypothetical protein